MGDGGDKDDEDKGGEKLGNKDGDDKSTITDEKKDAPKTVCTLKKSGSKFWRCRIRPGKCEDCGDCSWDTENKDCRTEKKGKPPIKGEILREILKSEGVWDLKGGESTWVKISTDEENANFKPLVNYKYPYDVKCCINGKEQDKTTNTKKRKTTIKNKNTEEDKTPVKQKKTTIKKITNPPEDEKKNKERERYLKEQKIELEKMRKKKTEDQKKKSDEDKKKR